MSITISVSMFPQLCESFSSFSLASSDPIRSRKTVCDCPWVFWGYYLSVVAITGTGLTSVVICCTTLSLILLYSLLHWRDSSVCICFGRGRMMPFKSMALVSRINLHPWPGVSRGLGCKQAAWSTLAALGRKIGCYIR